MNDKLTAFLYLLMRDHTIPGAVARCWREAVSARPDDRYTNEHLAAYARMVADKLTAATPLNGDAQSITQTDTNMELTRE